MRSRTVREGSVGLLILLGAALFGGLVMWLRGFSPGTRSYSIVADFATVVGMQEGSSVRYRGVNVGRITSMTPGPNGVAVTLEISPADLIIPRDAVVEANQSGLIGETYVSIVPRQLLPTGITVAQPLDPVCTTQQLILCDGSRVQGQIGVSIDQLIRSTTELAAIYSDPRFVTNLNALTQNAAVAAAEIAKVSREFSTLPVTIRQELGTVSATANSLNQSVAQTANQASLAANEVARTANQFGNTANQLTITTAQFGDTANVIRDEISGTTRQFGLTANQFGGLATDIRRSANQFGGVATDLSRTVNQYGRTADQFTQVAVSINGLLLENRAGLVTTLANFGQASTQLRDTLTGFTPTLTRFTTTFNQVNTDQLLRNVETISANAAIASENAAQISNNLRDVSSSLSDPRNALLLQQTLDSARSTFENTQKITADLDDLTGDPAFRSNLRNLVNGLGRLVSSTEELEQQVEVAKVLESLNSSVNEVEVPKNQQSLLNLTPNPTLSEALRVSQQQVNTENYYLDMAPTARRLKPGAIQTKSAYAD